MGAQFQGLQHIGGREAQAQLVVLPQRNLLAVGVAQRDLVDGMGVVKTLEEQFRCNRLKTRGLA